MGKLVVFFLCSFLPTRVVYTRWLIVLERSAAACFRVPTSPRLCSHCIRPVEEPQIACWTPFMLPVARVVNFSIRFYFRVFFFSAFVHHNYLSGTTAPPNRRFRFLCFMFLFPRFLARLGWKIESDNEFFDNHIQHGTTSRRFYFWPFDCVPVYQESND